MENDKMRELTGSVTGGSLSAFFYTLLRDHLPAGIVEKIVDQVEDRKEVQFTNGYIANYAKLIVSRLSPKNDVSIKINKVMTIAIGDIYDDLGTDPDKKVLSTQEVQSILIDIEDLLIKELESV